MSKAIVFDMDGTLYPHIEHDSVGHFLKMKEENEYRLQQNKELLFSLKSYGYDLFLASNSTSDFGVEIFQHWDIKDFFTQAFFYNNFPKKEEKLFQTLIDVKEKFDLVIMVGDKYETDIKPAEQLGINALQVDYNKSEKILVSVCQNLLQ